MCAWEEYDSVGVSLPEMQVMTSMFAWDWLLWIRITSLLLKTRL